MLNLFKLYMRFLKENVDDIPNDLKISIKCNFFDFIEPCDWIGHSILFSWRDTKQGESFWLTLHLKWLMIVNDYYWEKKGDSLIKYKETCKDLWKSYILDMRQYKYATSIDNANIMNELKEIKKQQDGTRYNGKKAQKS